MASPLWRPGGLVWRWRWSRPAGGVTETAPMSGSTPDKSRSAVRQTPAAHVAPPKPKSKPRSKPPRPRLSAGRPCPARPSCLCALRGRRARGIRRGRGGQSGQGHRRLRRLPGPNLCRTWHYTPGGYLGWWEGETVSNLKSQQGNFQTKSKTTSKARGLAAAKGCHHSARFYSRRLKRTPPPHGFTLCFTERFIIGPPSSRSSPLRGQRPRPGAGYAGMGAGRKPGPDLLHR